MSSPSLNMHLILPNWQFKKATTVETGKVFSSKAKKKKKKDLGIISIITSSQNDHQLWKRIAPRPLPKPRDSVPITLLKGQQSLPQQITAEEEKSLGGFRTCSHLEMLILTQNGRKVPWICRRGVNWESQVVPLVKDPPVPEMLIAQTEKKKISTLTRYVNLSILAKETVTLPGLQVLG